jgi:hypothetical protein
VTVESPGSVRRLIPTEDVRVRATARVLVVTLVLALLGACSGNDDSPSTEEQIQENAAAGDDAGVDVPDPCTLVTQQEAAELFATDARGTVGGVPSVLGELCGWENVDEADAVLPKQTLRTQVTRGEQYFLKSQFPDAKSVPGLGDDSYVNADEQTPDGVVVEFVKGDLVVSVTYNAFNNGVADSDRIDPAAREDAVIALAQEAERRL